MQSTSSLSARVAEEIRVALVRRRMSGKRLAHETGMSQSAISARLTGVTPIDLNELEKIADVLGVDLRDLLPARARDGGTTNARYRQTAVTAPGYADPNLTDRPPTYPLNDRSPALAPAQRARRPVVVDTQPWDSAQ